MKQPVRTSPKRLFSDEKRYFSNGVLPGARTLEGQLFTAHYREWNGRKCEAMLLQGQDASLSLLYRIKVLSFRGRLGSAAQAVAALVNERAAHEQHLVAELKLEAARLAIFDARWHD